MKFIITAFYIVGIAAGVAGIVEKSPLVGGGLLLLALWFLFGRK